MRIDKSVFTAEERAQYEALIAKAKVDPEAAEEEMEEEKPEVPFKKKPTQEETPMEKSASPELKAALEELADLKKSIEMKDMTEVAKKYAKLGKNEGELATTLYEMKKSNEANYNAYIAILDESLGLVEKSGLFAEIGKSAGNGSAPNGAVAKAEAKATELMKSNPDMGYDTALAKAWQDPAILAEYDAEYHG